MNLEPTPLPNSDPNLDNNSSLYIEQSQSNMSREDIEEEEAEEEASLNEEGEDDEDRETQDQDKDPENPNSARHLPIANVSRVMKRILDSETKISKESKEMVQQCVTDFISFITCEACEKCKNEKRKTINGDDLVYALEVFGFDKYVKVLKLYLAKYRQVR